MLCEIETDASPTVDIAPSAIAPAVPGSRPTTFIGLLNLVARGGDRLLTFGQIILVAAVFGATPRADLYFLASIVPLTIALVVGDPLGRSALTALSRLTERSDGIRFAGAGLVVSAAVLVALTAVYVAVAVVAVEISTPSGSSGLGPWLGFAPIVPFAGLTGYLSGLLLWTHRYGWAAFLNPVGTAVGLGLMLIVVRFGDRLGFVALAVSAGYAIALALAFVAVSRRLGWHWWHDFGRSDIRSALAIPRRIVSPAIGQVIGGQAIVALERVLALTIAVGAVSTLSYARGISAAPVFVAQGIAAGVYPGIVRADAAGDHQFVRDSFLTALRATLFVGCAFAIYFAFFGPSLGAALLQRGSLSETEATRVGHALVAFAPSTAAIGVLIFVVAVLFGIGEFRSVLERSVVGLIVYVVCAPVLMWTLHAWGLALAFSLSQVAAAGFASALVARKVGLSMRDLLSRAVLPISTMLAPVAVAVGGYRALVVAATPHIAVEWRGVVVLGTSFVVMVVVAAVVFLLSPLPESRRVRRLLDSRSELRPGT